MNENQRTIPFSRMFVQQTLQTPQLKHLKGEKIYTSKSTNFIRDSDVIPNT